MTTAPYIMKADYRIIRSSDAEKVTQIENEFREARFSMDRDLALGYECWKAYMAIHGGQWRDADLAVLLDELRHPWTFDVIGPKVDTLAGSIFSELPDMSWRPVEGVKTTATEALTESFYNDKELMKQDETMAFGIRDGLIHSNWWQLVESNKYGKPVLGFEKCLAGRVIPSPHWLTIDDRDCKDLWKVGYYIPEAIAFKWNNKSTQVMNAIRREENRRTQMPINSEQLRRRYQHMIGPEYMVIEYHWLEMVRRKRLVGIAVNENGHPHHVPFPVTDDRIKLEMHAQIHGVDWETVQERDYEDSIHRVTTICPDLDRALVLEDGKSKIQVKGLPFYHFTVTRSNGKNKGIVATLLDVQRTINARESLVTELIATANGGADLVDKGIFLNPEDAEEFRKKKNKPGHTQFADFSQLDGTRNPIHRVAPNQYPAQVLDQISRMYNEVLPLVSRVSDAMSSITDSNKSGVLFDKEYQVNLIANMIMNIGLRLVLKNMGEGYFYQSKISYAGEARAVTGRDGKEHVLNERVVMQDGTVGIRNSIEHIPRCKVVITTAENAPSYKARTRSMWGEVIQNTNPELVPEHWMFAFTQFMNTMDLDEKAQGQLEQLNQMTMSKVHMKFISDLTGLHSQVKQNELTAVQAEQLLQQISQQMGQMRQTLGGGSREEVQEQVVPDEGGQQLVAEGSARPETQI